MPWGVAAVIGGAVVSGVASNNASNKQKKSANDAMNLQRDQFNLVQQQTAPQREIGTGALYKLADMLGIDRAAPTAPTREMFTTVNGSPMQDRSAWEKWGTDVPGKASDPIGILGTKNTNTVNKVISGGLLGRSSKSNNPLTSFDEDAYNDAVKKHEQQLNEFNNRPRGMNAFTADPGYQFRLDNTNKAIDRYQSAGRVTGGRAIKEAERYGQDFASNEFGNATNRLFTLAGYGPAANAQSAASGQNMANMNSQLSLYGGNAAANNYTNLNNTVQGGIQNAHTLKQYNDWNSKFQTKPDPQISPDVYTG